MSAFEYDLALWQEFFEAGESDVVAALGIDGALKALGSNARTGIAGDSVAMRRDVGGSNDIAAEDKKKGCGFFGVGKAKPSWYAAAVQQRTDPVTVVRGGETTEVQRGDVVVGDVVLLGAGMKVPADVILIEGVVGVYEGDLTGESDTIPKRAAAGRDGRICADSEIREGAGRAVVCAVGRNTLMIKVLSSSE